MTSLYNAYVYKYIYAHMNSGMVVSWKSEIRKMILFQKQKLVGKGIVTKMFVSDYKRNFSKFRFAIVVIYFWRSEFRPSLQHICM